MWELRTIGQSPIDPWVRAVWIPLVRAVWIPLVRAVWTPWVRAPLTPGSELCGPPLVRAVWTHWVRVAWTLWFRIAWTSLVKAPLTSGSESRGHPWVRARELVGSEPGGHPGSEPHWSPCQRLVDTLGAVDKSVCRVAMCICVNMNTNLWKVSKIHSNCHTSVLPGVLLDVRRGDGRVRVAGGDDAGR